MAFIEKIMILKTLYLFSAVLLFFITARPLVAEETNIMHYDEGTLVGMTIGELLENKQIEPGKWCWVFEGPDISINKSIFEWYDVMGERKKAHLVDPYYYVHNQSDPNVSIHYKVQSWKAYMFAEKEKGDGGGLSLQRIVFLHHYPKQIELADAIKSTMNLEGRDAGFYFFKNSTEGLVETNYDDLPFLKHYYQVEIKKQDDASLTVLTFEVFPRVVGYEIFEYYPNGRIHRFTSIKERKDDMPPDKSKKISMWLLTAEYKDGPERPPVKLGESEPMNISDSKHPYWLPNILHD